MATASDYEITGWRYIECTDAPAPVPGQALPPSRVWDGEVPTGEELSGTCAFDTRAACEAYAKYSRGHGWMAHIGGVCKGTAGDIAGEILIGDAEVIEITDW